MSDNIEIIVIDGDRVIGRYTSEESMFVGDRMDEIIETMNDFGHEMREDED